MELTCNVRQKKQTAHQNLSIHTISQNIFIERIQKSDRNVYSNDTS